MPQKSSQPPKIAALVRAASFAILEWGCAAPDLGSVRLTGAIGSVGEKTEKALADLPRSRHLSRAHRGGHNRRRRDGAPLRKAMAPCGKNHGGRRAEQVRSPTQATVCFSPVMGGRWPTTAIFSRPATCLDGPHSPDDPDWVSFGSGAHAAIRLGR